MATLVKGFAVGRTSLNYRSDGSSSSRPKLLEVETGPREVAVSIDASIVWLDLEAATRARDLLNDAIEAIS